MGLCLLARGRKPLGALRTCESCGQKGEAMESQKVSVGYDEGSCSGERARKKGDTIFDVKDCRTKYRGKALAVREVKSVE